MEKKIVVTGSLAFDVIMNFHGRFGDQILPDKIHALNLSFLVDKMEKTRGGTAGNIAYNLGILECQPVLLSTFGRDGEEYKDFLKNSGVDVSSAPISKKYYTSQSFVLTDSADNQIHSFYGGAMGENEKLTIVPVIASERSERGNLLKNNKIASSSSTSRNDKKTAVISPNTPESMKKFVDECIQNHVGYMYDPGMQLPRLLDEDLQRGVDNCEILIGNDYEIELMRKRVGDLKPPILITTLGEKGAVIFKTPRVETLHATSLHRKNPEQHVMISAKPKSVVDPTGAGDAFRAGFLAGYTRDFDLKTCGQMGATCAAYTVEKYGTTTHRFTVKEFCERHEENYGEELKL